MTLSRFAAPDAIVVNPYCEKRQPLPVLHGGVGCPIWRSSLAWESRGSLSMSFRLLVPRSLLEGLIAQAVAERPNECCGLLAGVREEGKMGEGSAATIGRVLRRYPLVNALASPREFLSDGRSMLDADKDMRLRGTGPPGGVPLAPYVAPRSPAAPTWRATGWRKWFA